VPAAVAAAALLGVSAVAFGSAFRPGILPEILLVLYIAFLTSLVQRRRFVASAFSTLLVVVVYGAALMKWVVFDEPLRLADVALLGELWRSVTWPWPALAAAVCAAAAVAALANLRRPSRRDALAFVPLFVFAAAAAAAPGRLLATLDVVRPDIYWRPVDRTWRAGPVFSLARQIPETIRIRRALARIDGPAGRLRPLAHRSVRLPNVHVVVMESFVDPLNFREAAFGGDPVDARFRRWMNESASLALSPTFGGQTARAEFELLCGVPSYATLGVEMNLVERPVRCLPQLLRGAGYRTWASVPVSPSFFRVGRAYPALGFEQRFFGDSFDLSDMDGLWLADASTLTQTLTRLRAHRDSSRPMFDYIVTTAGHEPFERDAVRRPTVVFGDSWMFRMANAVHYSSRAAADFVEAIEAGDADAVVVVVGDHLPIFGTTNREFATSRYRLAVPGAPPIEWSAGSLATRATPLVVRRARQSINVGITPHYALADTILDLISGGEYCASLPCITNKPSAGRPLGERATSDDPAMRRAYDGLLAAAIPH
jgi:hypothetical protein